MNGMMLRIAVAALLITAVFTCGSGEYMVAAICYKCPAGFRCSGDLAIKCPAGTYSDFGASSCTTCPEGYKCPDASKPPIGCAYNEFSEAGSIACFPVPVGAKVSYEGKISYCTSATEVCNSGPWIDAAAPGSIAVYGVEVTCSDGYYLVGTTCTICPAGKYCPNHVMAYTCDLGYYSKAGSTECIVCPAGYKCPSGSTDPEPCAAGYWAHERSLVCYECPKGYKCPSPCAFPTACPPGEYAVAGSQMCKKCPVNHECITGEAVSCAAGYFSIGGAGVCTKCPAGKSCGSAGPKDCPFGSYSAFGVTTCTKASAGHYVTAGKDQQLPCPLYTYQPSEGAESCLECKGSGCTSTGSTSCTTCKKGQFFDGLSECIDCPAGHYCPDPTSAIVKPCPAGFYAKEAQSSCSICPEGNYSGNGNETLACPDGYFSVIGQRKCEKCPTGYACNYKLKNVLGVVKCHPGYYIKDGMCEICPIGAMCPYPELGPINCTNGTYAAQSGYSLCLPCPYGFNCSTTEILGQCGDGEYSYLGEYNCSSCPEFHACKHGFIEECPINYNVSINKTECEPCADNSTCLRKHTLVNCEPGFYARTSTYTCLLCPVGYYCYGNVTECEPNTYAPYEGMQECLPCPVGTFSPNGSDRCYPCPAGYSCNTSITNYTLCPFGQGYSCNDSVSHYIRCPAGQYSDIHMTNCSVGYPGYIYYEGTGFALPDTQLVSRGAYSVVDNETIIIKLNCPSGTYNPSFGSVSSAECFTCPGGYYCPEETGDPRLFECPVGYYCPSGSSLPIMCPENTFNSEKKMDHESSCQPCQQGYYCPEGSSNPGACPLGHYCPYGAKQPCVGGTYSGGRTGLREAGECILCPAGYYCPDGTDYPIPAPKGHYIPLMGMSSNNSAVKCPPSYPCIETGLSIYRGAPCRLGYYCPGGTTALYEFPCPAGTFSSSYYATTVEDCHPCPRGYYCPEGTSQANVNICPIGYYCPRGTPAVNSFPCPAGTYMPSTGARKLEDCIPCPNGAFCVEGSSVAGVTCPAKYYCPLGTKYDEQYPCPAGTFSSSTGLKASQECTLCGLGNYCIGGKSSATPCETGTYNDFSYTATSCKVCPAGSYCVSGTTTPTPCAVGHYSAAGANACTVCEIGYFCPETGISQADKLSLYACYAGMYCKDGSGNGLNVYPDLDTYGCSAGKYCPAGTTTEVDCPAGTYNPVKGRSSLSDCITTPAGYYTTAGIFDYSSLLCSPGYFCLAGSKTSTPNKCPAGTYRTLPGAGDPTECSDCPSGKYCEEGTHTPADCPKGFYCPIRTVTPESCPEGTYSDVLGLFDSKSCKSCPAGKYCYQRNMTTAPDNCDAGFYCIQGSKRPEPKDNITGNLCPVGGYCPSGCASSQPCAAGKIMLIEGAKLATQCVPCTPGYYCEGSNSSEPTGKCDAGFYCGFGENVSAPAGKEALAGYYAPLGSQFMIACPRGTFSDSPQKSSCDECDPGYFCGNVRGTTKPPCPTGYYCNSLSWFQTYSLSYDKKPCPIGTFNPNISRASSNDCKACTAGSYCEQPGLSAVSGDCSAGYYCTTRARYARPPIEVSSSYGPCPAGKYCGTASKIPANCPTGTYSASTMLEASNQCITCYEGKYCASEGLTEPTGDCTAGHKCSEGSISATPSPCGAAKYCPASSGVEINCPTGFYNSAAAATTCTECPKGYFCHSGTRFDCIAGFYCP